jgi:SWI/SNF-related matrix-associated actin-dependent regulator 1 of chromatin subfamily A
MKTLYPVQERHVKRLLDLLTSRSSALDMSDTGTGKTLCAINVAKELNRPVLVICPKAVIPSWKRELDEQGVPADVINYEKVRMGSTPFMQWCGKGKNMLWKLDPATLIIFDEVHKCAGQGTQNSELLTSASIQGFKTLLLSATVASSPVQLKAVGTALRVFPPSGFYRWVREMGVSFGGPFGPTFIRTEANEKKLAQTIAPHASRMTRADLSDHFTETQIITEPLDFGDKIQAIYREMDAELAELASKQSRDRGANEMVAILRARQKTELLKVPILVEFAQEALDEGKSVAIFINFSDTLQAVLAKFPAAGTVHGSQTAAERQAAIDAFQTDRSRVIILNAAAGGTGVSLHDVTGKHPRLALISPDWDEKKVVQVMGRVHRAGGKTPSQQRVLFASGTIEERVEKSLRQKIQTMNILNDESAIQTSDTNVEDLGTMTKESPLPTPVDVSPEPMLEPTSAPPVDVVPKVTTPEAKVTTPEAKVTSSETQANAGGAHIERKHAEHSPSSLKMFESCPSYKKRDGETNAIAEIGTRIHEAIETGDMSKLDPQQIELAEYCLAFRTWVQGQKKAAGLLSIKTLEEVRIAIQLPPTDGTFGSFDYLEIFNDNSAVLLDWKTGFHPVDDAEQNAQVWAYALGILQKWKQIKTLDCYLVMPRRAEVSHATFTRDDMGRMSLRLGTIIMRAKELSGKEYTPTEGVCDYCGNRGSCQALATTALKLSQKSGFMVPDSIDLSQATETDKASLYKLAVLMEKWCEDTKKELMRQTLEEGLSMPGYYLDQRKSPRTIDAPVVAWNALKEKLTLEEFLSAASRISVSALETLYSEKAPKGKKGAWKEELNEILEESSALKEPGVINILKATKA